MSKRTPSGSEQRQRDRLSAVRWTPEEWAKVEAAAAHAALPVGSYVRARALGRRIRRAKAQLPKPDREQLARALALLGRLGGNMNQIAHAANVGRAPYEPELLAELEEVRRLRAEMRAALGLSQP